MTAKTSEHHASAGGFGVGDVAAGFSAGVTGSGDRKKHAAPRRRGLTSRIVGVFPFAYAVWRKRNIYLGLAVLMFLDGVGAALTIVAVAGDLA